jgi:pyruvate ferredoxin oxidoreductase beta subunit/2-oxoisovalerate ferredoxin oxidoreductase beta subunit
MRLILRELGSRSMIVVVPSCVSVIAGPFPHASIDASVYHAAFETAAASAAGIATALRGRGVDDVPVAAFAGDGGTFDIGLQSLSGAAARNDDIIYVCMDNEGYMNTGIQVSSATPRHTWTGTTPAGNPRPKKQIMEIMAAHRIPYAATAAIGFPEDLRYKIRRALSFRGTRFIHALTPCVGGWKIEDDQGPAVSAAAVKTNVFPLYEIEGGLRYTINHRPAPRPVSDYLSRQGRYRGLSPEQIEAIQQETDAAWRRLVGKENEVLS